MDIDDRDRRLGAGRAKPAVAVGVLAAIAVGLFVFFIGVPSRSGPDGLGAHDRSAALLIGAVIGVVAGWLTFRRGIRSWIDPNTGRTDPKTPRH
ncbi:hypothetical protein [Micromonospora siamensis]|uniref:Uncharacterized protein n=1 Tax=Micromonospora siamensis TaxID=299152 RepID=A0A1C5JNJ1_9ACTN|nr:hypothetical protein [Micromonospora siamensis]SCG72155.1 hypothetical protein GA0074704_4726 [Micromonospora siamensis]